MLARQIETVTTLDLPLRGSRDYVHSTDLFAALEDLAATLLPSPAYPRSLILRRVARARVEAHFAPHPDAFGTFVLAAPRARMPGWLVESHAPIARRTAFDENAIVRAAVVEPGRVFLPGPVAGATAFERMIVLFKILCAQSQAGAWLFTALDLKDALRPDAAIGLTLAQTVLNRLIVADLHQDGRPIGQVQMVLSPIAGADA